METIAQRVAAAHRIIDEQTRIVESLKLECPHEQRVPCASVQIPGEPSFNVSQSCTACGDVLVASSNTPACVTCKTMMVDVVSEPDITKKAQELTDSIYGPKSYYAGCAFRCPKCGAIDFISFWDR